MNNWLPEIGKSGQTVCVFISPTFYETPAERDHPSYEAILERRRMSRFEMKCRRRVLGRM